LVREWGILFCKGIASYPDVSAEKWAKAEAWDKGKRAYFYKNMQ
jgi:hypothetical protein